MTLKDIRAHRAAILAIAARYGARNVQVFGSLVRGQADAASDVDFDLGGLLMDPGGASALQGRRDDPAMLKSRVRDGGLREVMPL